MKKNSASLFLAAFATLFMLSACQTFKVNVSEEPVFVIASVHANPNLPWKIATSDLRSDYNEDTVGNGSLINNQINKIFNKDDPELLGAQNRCDYIPEALERYFKQAGVKYVEHSVFMETEICQLILGGIRIVIINHGYFQAHSFQFLIWIKIIVIKSIIINHN